MSYPYNYLIWIIVSAGDTAGTTFPVTVKRAFGLLGGPTILVGHAYGGFVITNAAYNTPDVKGLVYVA